MKSFFSSSNQRIQLWLSLVLFFLCYWVWGWLCGAAIPGWIDWITNQSILTILPISLSDFPWVIEFLTIFLIFLIIVALISPFDLIAVFFGISFKSDKQAFISLLISTVVAIILLCRFDFFVRLSILFAAGILARLDLQNNKVRKKVSSLILIFLATVAFGLGFLCFNFWGVRVFGH